MTHTKIDFTRIDNDVNGNPRYVCHFLNLINNEDTELAEQLQNSRTPIRFASSYLYDIAVNKARKIGGKRYSTKKYGGGIVFQSYNIEETERHILEIVNGGKS